MLFQRLLKANEKAWDVYLHHEFVRQLEKGVLKKENFLFYLKQDYIFLINYAKAFARLCLNADNAKELRFAMKFQNYIVEGELELHKSILQMGINADKLSVKDESFTNIAYTRYVLSVGDSGNYLDMLVALSACATGYGYIGRELLERLDAKALESHPYKEWILTYSGDEFQAEVKEFEDFVNSYKVDEAYFTKLSEIFNTTTRLETAFWQHALTMQLEF